MFLLITFSFLFSTPLLAEAEEERQVNAIAAMLIDFETGQILYHQNSDEKLGIASMTKMMTEYIISEENGNGQSVLGRLR